VDAFTASYVVLWLVVLVVGFLLFAAIRQIGLLSWRLEQLAATTPSRIERNGLQPGTKAPDFTLPDTGGEAVSLREYHGRKALLVFMQPGCGPCEALAAELNRYLNRDGLAVLAISNADPEENRRWREEIGAKFPILAQQHLSVSRQYQAFATPFAFLVDEEGMIRARGVANKKQHLDLLFSSAKGSKGEAVVAAGHG
jgi:methylamine dehydrogenase accessory protein MauD